MITPNFTEIIDFAFRSQLAYGITQPSWEIAKIIGWIPSISRQFYIHNVPNLEINVILEIDQTIPCQWIAIRGSSNLKNWLLDFDYMEYSFRKSYLVNQPKSIRFHQGFYKAADNIYTEIINYIDDSYPLRITGHSLGGAIAVILMILLKEKGLNIEKTITFGQPKVTNMKGASWYESFPLLRIINQQDVVPSLPPDTLLTEPQGGYQHFAPEILLQSGNYLFHSQPVDHNSADSFWSHLIKASTQTDLKDLFNNIEDHYIENYLISLLSQLTEPDITLQTLLQQK